MKDHVEVRGFRGLGRRRGGGPVDFEVDVLEHALKTQRHGTLQVMRRSIRLITRRLVQGLLEQKVTQ